jgi:hypothetical protein
MRLWVGGFVRPKCRPPPIGFVRLKRLRAPHAPLGRWVRLAKMPASSDWLRSAEAVARPHAPLGRWVRLAKCRPPPIGFVLLKRLRAHHAPVASAPLIPTVADLPSSCPALCSLVAGIHVLKRKRRQRRRWPGQAWTSPAMTMARVIAFDGWNYAQLPRMPQSYLVHVT